MFFFLSLLYGCAPEQAKQNQVFFALPGLTKSETSVRESQGIDGTWSAPIRDIIRGTGDGDVSRM